MDDKVDATMIEYECNDNVDQPWCTVVEYYYSAIEVRTV